MVDGAGRPAAEPGAPPRPPRRPQRRSRHGIGWVDDYLWLRDTTDPAVGRLLEAENAHADGWFSSREELITTLCGEFAARSCPERLEPVLALGEFLYSWQHLSERDYPILVRDRLCAGGLGERTVLLDLAEEAVSHPDLRVGEVQVSPDGEFLAYTVAPAGDDAFGVRVRPVRGGTALTLAERAGPTVAWSPDAGTLYFTVLDDEWRPASLAASDPRGAGPVSRLLVEDDEGFILSVATCTSGRTVCVYSESQEVTEVRLIHAGGRLGAPILARAAGLVYEVDECAGRVLLTITAGAATEVAVRDLDGADVRTLGRFEAPDTVEQAMAARDEAVLVMGRGLARSVAALPYDAGGAGVRVLVPPEIATLTLVPRRGGEPAGGADALYVHEGHLSPPRVCAVGTSGRSILFDAAPPGLQPARYRCDWFRVPTSDGVAVPVTVLRPASGGDCPIPLVLFGYGAYGETVEPRFMPFRLSLLDRGIGFAVAHVRGGGEGGAKWHDGGRGERKVRGIRDYLECIRWLVSAGVAADGAVVARCGSAGGALVGAALNESPQSFAGVVAERPFVDCLATLLDEDSPFTSFEWGEWGDPVHSEADFRSIRSYSPYDNVRRAAYPPVYATAARDDIRVPPYEPARWLARIRELSTSGTPALLGVSTGGHDGRASRSEDWRGEARILAFVIDSLLGRPR